MEELEGETWGEAASACLQHFRCSAEGWAPVTSQTLVGSGVERRGKESARPRAGSVFPGWGGERRRAASGLVDRPDELSGDGGVALGSGAVGARFQRCGVWVLSGLVGETNAAGAHFRQSG